MSTPLPPTEVARREALIREHYATGDLKQLADQVGVAVSALQAMASVLGVRRAQRPKTKQIIDLLLRLADQPRGTSIADVARQAQGLGVTCSAVESAAQRLLRSGELHKARISHRMVRLCRTAEVAQRLLATMAPPPKKAAPGLRVESVRTTPGGATTVHVQMVRGPAYLPGEPVITSATKVTIAPAPKVALRSNTYLMSA